MLNLQSHHSPTSPRGPRGAPAATGSASNNDTLNNIGEAPDLVSDTDENIWSETGDGDYHADLPTGDELLAKLPNIFRLLDLVQETELEGGAKKVIIDQASLGRLLNRFLPGSYVSASKIDLTALNKLTIKPLGLYGSEPEIIKFLQGVQCLSDRDVTLLSSTSLCSGLYLVLAPPDATQDTEAHSAYIVYWPETTTWQDDASSSVRNHRLMFMRYLSKLVDQTIALISAEQADSIVWPEDIEDPEEEFRKREFKFTVKKTEEKEDVTVTPGFTFNVISQDIPKIDIASSVELVGGDGQAGLMVSWREPDRCTTEPFDEIWTEADLRARIKSTTHTLTPGALTAKRLLILSDNGLRDMYPQPFLEYDRRMETKTQKWTEGWKTAAQRVDDQIERDEPRLESFITRIIRDIYREMFLLRTVELDSSEEFDPDDDVLLRMQYPDLEHLPQDIKEKHDLGSISDPAYEDLKKAWSITRSFIERKPQPSEERQLAFVRAVLDARSDRRGSRSKYNLKSKSRKAWEEFMAATGVTSSEILEDSPETSELDFITSLQPFVEMHPATSELGGRIIDLFRSYQAATETKLLDEYMGYVMGKEQDRRLKEQKELQDNLFRFESDTVLSTLHEQLQLKIPQDKERVLIDSIELIESEPINYHVCGRMITRHGPWSTRVLVYPFVLDETEAQKPQSDVPAHKLRLSQSFRFVLREGDDIRLLRLLSDGCLIVIADSNVCQVYVGPNQQLGNAIHRRASKRVFSNDRLGECYAFAFDEYSRLLAVLCDSEDPKILTYKLDSQSSAFGLYGATVGLRSRYGIESTFEKMFFISRSEELCLVGSSGCMRILSPATEILHPASITIDTRMVDAFSTPDGSLILASVVADESSVSEHKILAIYTASFGSDNAGIRPDYILPYSDSGRVAICASNRNRAYVLSLGVKDKIIFSSALHLKQRCSNFLLCSPGDENSGWTNPITNNCLLDCHAEIWTHFPVIPAVPKTILAYNDQKPRKLILASPRHLDPICNYFVLMLAKFREDIKKPVDKQLVAGLATSSDPPGPLVRKIACSRYYLGVFVAQVLCLIPLQLAVTHNEHLQTGEADTSTIVNAFNLSWYESIFQLYIERPVRVVSSMGMKGPEETYLLNYFADTCFSESIMRTTNGMWLSCTLARDYLLVVLDLEGIQSARRIPEDALLVLLGVALSDLTLFQDSFGLSKDFTRLYATFQPCVDILNKRFNTSLFRKSQLAVIIDHVEGLNHREIVAEYSAQLRRVTEHTQEQNFITQLYGGCVTVVPLPTMHSPRFYTLLQSIGRSLEDQPVIHSSGNVFLRHLEAHIAEFMVSLTLLSGFVASTLLVSQVQGEALDCEPQIHQKDVYYTSPPIDEEGPAKCCSQWILRQLPYALSHGRTKEGPLPTLAGKRLAASKAWSTSFQTW
ncbi:hypothetical protein FRC12_002184 [Ceratobasidium sp. 428]|nr:hypothetical protein FRC12_002184 [Ceratobasidium sp. 428]